MNFPDLSKSKKQWDKYEAFHWIVHGPNWQGGGDPIFVAFDTGEVIMPKCNFDRQENLRRHYSDLDVAIYYTTDPKCPKFKSKDGEPIPMSHLNFKGSETVLIDYKFKMAVGVSYPGHKSQLPNYAKAFPDRFQGIACVYWAGASHMPLGAPIKATRKRKLAEHETRHLAEIRSAIIARWEMEGITDKMREAFNSQREKSPLDGEWLLKNNFTDLTDDQQRRYYFNGRTDILETIVHPYLLLA